MRFGEDWVEGEIAQTVIDYQYDALYRLTQANYSDGAFFHYAYDSNGNRVSETTEVGTVESVYDVANRLTSVGATGYTWDANGNLTNDGVRTYNYNTANRLTGVTLNGQTVNYRYNGLGDRLVEGETEFEMDLNAGLTQVLSNGTNTYLYGNGRIGQFTGMDSAYFLGDALGSVRQMVDNGGVITQAKDYKPYGEVLNNAGTASSNFGFTGEETDRTGLIFLRARYMVPSMGRFLSKDSWQGDFVKPISYIPWIYAYSNPILNIDPTGLFPLPAVHRHVNLSSSIPYSQTEPPSQYIRIDGREKYNLCGHISLEMIYETITGSSNKLDYIVRNDPYNLETGINDDGSGVGNLEYIVQATFPPGWVAQGLSGKTISEQVSGANFYRYTPLMHDWFLDNARRDISVEVVYKGLEMQHYIVASVVLDTHTGRVSEHVKSPNEPKRYVAHWVVVTGYWNGLVVINNPFYNMEEYVSEAVFRTSTRNSLGTILEVYPQSSRTSLKDVLLECGAQINGEAKGGFERGSR